MFSKWLATIKHPPKQVKANEKPRYPGFNQGITAQPIDSLVASQHELIQAIILARGLAGIHNQPLAMLWVINPITELAQWVHDLPASDARHYKEPGGLFKFCLEQGLFSIRSAERSILTRVTPEARRESERLWTHAAFLAGLVSEAVLVLASISIYSDNGKSWHPGVQPLTSWLIQHKVKKYHIRWLGKADTGMMAAIAAKIILQEQAEILAQGEKSLLPTLMSAIQSPQQGSNPLVAIVRPLRLKLINKALAEDPSNYGKPLSGMHLEPWLIDAMRHMLSNRHWLLNSQGGRVWSGLDGVYLLWPLSGSDIRHELRQAQCPFVPRTVEILADMMLEAEMIARNENGGYLFTITVPYLNSQAKAVAALKLTRKELLLLDDNNLPVVLNTAYASEPVLPDNQHTIFAEPNFSSEQIMVDDVELFSEQDTTSLAESNQNTVYDQEYIRQYANFNATAAPALMNDGIQSTTPANNPTNKATPSRVEHSWLQELLTPVVQQKTPSGVNIVYRLSQLPKKFIEITSNGDSKINVQGLRFINVDIKACVDELKTLDRLVLIDGSAIALERQGNKDIRYFIVKGDVRHVRT